MTLGFRPLTSAGIPTAIEWIERLYAHEHIAFDPARSRRALEGLLADPRYGGFWFLDVDGAAVGYLVILVGYSLEFGGRFALLDELYLDESWRGKGIGAQALAFAETWCATEGLDTIRLEVGLENVRALGLYRRSGFRVEERSFMTRRL